MKAQYEIKNNDSEWEIETIDTDNIPNDSRQEWSEEMLLNYLNDVAEIRNFEII